MQGWGAHSTRGAAVGFFKHLGLTSEEVCELGQWKNVQAFTQHYLRLGAPKKAAHQIQKWVHSQVSLGTFEELERLHTPPKNEEGGCNLESDEKGTNEPTHPPKRPRSPQQDTPRKFVFAASRTRAANANHAASKQ